MSMIRDFPLLVFVLSLIVMWLSAQIGDFFRKRSRQLEEGERIDLSTVLTATLTLPEVAPTPCSWTTILGWSRKRSAIILQNARTGSNT